MKCYVCAKDNQSNEAVAVCAECGMGLCMDHAGYHEFPEMPRGMVQIKRSPMSILCETCEKALHLAS